MKLTVNVKDTRQHIDLWLKLWMGGLKLTDRETSVLAEILVREDKLDSEGIKEPYMTKLLFDSDSRKIYCATLKISSFNLTNVLTSLKTKMALNEDMSINPNLIPKESLTFEFKYDN